MILSRRDASRLVQRGCVLAYFQPIEDLQTGECLGFEALARLPWHDKILTPDVFLPLLGPDDRLNLFGTMLGEAIALLRHRQKRGQAVYVSINVEISLLVSDDFVDVLHYFLERYDFSKERLVLEILENEEVSDIALLASRLSAIHALGLSLALDDIGSGYASLAKVKTLPVDICKLDRAFVRDLADKPEDLVFVMSVQLLTQGLGKSLVVEGIETPETYDALRILGVRFGQGYHIAPPMPPAQIDDWIAGRATRAPDRIPKCLLGTYASVLCVGECCRALRLQPLPMTWTAEAMDHVDCAVGKLFGPRGWHTTAFGRAHIEFHVALTTYDTDEARYQAAFARFRETMATALRNRPGAYRCTPEEPPALSLDVRPQLRRRRRVVA